MISWKFSWKYFYTRTKTVIIDCNTIISTIIAIMLTTSAKFHSIYS